MGGISPPPPTQTVFTETKNGVVPAPNEAAGLFLRDDATWAAAGGSGAQPILSAVFQSNNVGVFTILDDNSGGLIVPADFTHVATGSYTYTPAFFVHPFAWCFVMDNTGGINMIKISGGGCRSMLVNIRAFNYNAGVWTAIDQTPIMLCFQQALA